jgi:Tfp pilus assembly protein PilP
MKHILVCVVAAGLAWAQSPEVIQNTRTMMQTVQRNETNATNQALEQVQPAAAAHNAQHGGTSTFHPAPAKSSAHAVKAASVQPKQKVAVEKHSAGTKPAKAAAAPKKVARTATLKNAVQTSQASAKDAAAEPAKGDDGSAPETNKWSMAGKRDPFISPVVSHAGGSGCSTGKKCLEIGEINLRGIVHAEAGFIAVVTNNLNKAYFLRENDPVFNGYVIKITGDSITFKEMMQDRLGKPFSREVVKKIVTPAV